MSKSRFEPDGTLFWFGKWKLGSKFFQPTASEGRGFQSKVPTIEKIVVIVGVVAKTSK